MTSAYVGILSLCGLELYYRERDQLARYLAERLRRTRQSRACCVWFVMDDQFETTLDALLAAGQHAGAWAFVQDAAREAGTMLHDDLSFHCGRRV